MDQIIKSPLENDLYKWNMMNVVFKNFNDRQTVWRFKCRNANVKFTPEMINEIRHQIDLYCANVCYTEDEIGYLRNTFPWLSEGFLNFLRYWRPNRNEIKINEGNIQAYNDCGLAIEARGMWLNVSWYEMPILAIVSEVYNAFTYGDGAKDIEFQKRTIEKFNKILDGTYNVGTFSEFGLRRRYSSAMQDWLIKYIVDQKIPGFVGTSNVYLAKKYGVKAVGTTAHEMPMCMMTDPEFNPAYVNKRLMEVWTQEYGVENGIYLTDVIGREAFLMDFNKRYATLYSGLRHDSGDPIEWGEAMIAHYQKLKIDPKMKTLLFSDALDFERATNIKRHFDGRINVAFGIGTYLAGIQDEKPLNIVMKVATCNGHPTCKLTDNPDKAMGDPVCIDYIRRAVDWKIRF